MFFFLYFGFSCRIAFGVGGSSSSWEKQRVRIASDLDISKLPVCFLELFCEFICQMDETVPEKHC